VTSGGELFGGRGGRQVLLGVISTVDLGLSYNSLAPPSAVRELLRDRGRYSHPIPAEVRAAPAPIARG
jgi:hypothetical protein